MQVTSPKSCGMTSVMLSMLIEGEDEMLKRCSELDKSCPLTIHWKEADLWEEKTVQLMSRGVPNLTSVVEETIST